MKKQVFVYLWGTPRVGDALYAIGNSDRYPLPLEDKTPEGKIQDETLKAVVNEVDAVPMRVCHLRRLVDTKKMQRLVSADTSKEFLALSEDVLTIEPKEGELLR